MLVLDPEVLLLDEPTAGLDPRSESQIIDMLIAWGDGARTVITTTHDLGLVEDIADHCVVLHEGKVAAAGEPATLLSDQALLSRTNMRIHAHFGTGMRPESSIRTRIATIRQEAGCDCRKQRIPGADCPGFEDAFFDEGVGCHQRFDFFFGGGFCRRSRLRRLR